MSVHAAPESAAASADRRGAGRNVRVALFSYTAEKNALGRAYSLWLVGRELGWEVRTVAPKAGSVWAPLAGEARFLADLAADAASAAAWCDLAVALKPWPGSLDVALALGRKTGKPVVLDVDDPDWEHRFGTTRGSQLRSFLAGLAKGRPPVAFYRLRRQASRLRRVVISNPALAHWYPQGTVVPHARLDRPEGAPHTRETGIEVAFVGSVRPYKGLEVLRAAVERARDARLTVTAPPPADAATHETWTGETSLEEGFDLLDRADVVAVPSLDSAYGRAQLPVKLIDAMISGRAVVASDLPPIRWALSDTGLLVPPGDGERLARALDSLRSPGLRAELGASARARALATFTPEAVAPLLSEALRAAA